MIVSGLKEFADGDTTLFSGNMLTGLDSQEDFETEFKKLLTDEEGVLFGCLDSTKEFDAADTIDNLSSSTLNQQKVPAIEIAASSFISQLTSIDQLQMSSAGSGNSSMVDFYASPPDIMKFEEEMMRFEEDPLSSYLNAEQQQKQNTPKKKRGRPPGVIKFKPNEYKIKSTTRPQSTAKHSEIKCIKKPTPSPSSATIHVRDRRSEHDLYTPIWIRGRGAEREGLCPLCEPQVWFKIKQSAYWYHMNFFHGISASTGRPYKLPLSYRSDDGKAVEGHCGSCFQWIQITGDYNYGGEIEVLSTSKEEIENSLSFQSWYKHSQKCHHRVREIQIPDELDLK